MKKWGVEYVQLLQLGRVEAAGVEAVDEQDGHVDVPVYLGTLQGFRAVVVNLHLDVGVVEGEQRARLRVISTVVFFPSANDNVKLCSET